MRNIWRIILIALVTLSANCLRLFMIGGHAFDSPFYNDLAAAVAGR
jgi:cyanophycinase-like exopeptidase